MRIWPGRAATMSNSSRSYSGSKIYDVKSSVAAVVFGNNLFGRMAGGLARPKIIEKALQGLMGDQE